jgi:hypothetical protein
MVFFSPRKRIHIEPIEIESQPRTWITKHRSFATAEWVESQVRYGEWIPDRSSKDQFLIYVTVFEGIKPLTVLLKIKMFETYILVFHVHVLRNK